MSILTLQLLSHFSLAVRDLGIPLEAGLGMGNRLRDRFREMYDI